MLLNIDLDFYFKEKLSMLANEIKETLLTKNIESNVQNSVITLNSIDDYKKASVLINAINPNLELNRKDSSILIRINHIIKIL